MATARQASNKAKIARRVVEVLEFFDEDHPEATVMDIVRRYDRPQSSTSELLSSLVELGLLHKDPYSRSYRPTVRAALLGTTSQEEIVRDGRLVRFMDRLVAQTGHPVFLFAKVGLETQIVSFRRGKRSALKGLDDLVGGRKEPLTRNAAGWLLLSTLDPSQRDGAVRRLNAEADDGDKFNYPEMLSRISQCCDRNFATGPVGFGSEAQVVSALLPWQPHEHPLAAGIVFDKNSSISPDVLAQCIEDAARSCLFDPETSQVKELLTAA